MLLTARTVAPYLLDRGLVTPAEVVDGDFSVLDMSRRNRNLRVRRGARPGLFVKQSLDWEPHSVETLRREATCYLLARDDPDFAALGELLPRFVDWDAGRHVLALELLPGDETLAEYHRRVNGFPLETADRLGAMLGSYHRHAGSARGRDAGQDAVFPRGIPWILNVMHHNPAHVGPVAGGNQEINRILGRYPEYGAALDELRTGWRREALIHGDMKWENVIVVPADAEGEAPRLRIVDWELADFGDPGWDVGSIFQAYLSFWILSMRGAGQAPPDQLTALAEFPLERMQPAMAAFWDAYARTLGADAGAEAERLRRSALYAAARMLQTAWEYTAWTGQLSSNLLVMLQAAMNILVRPDDAVRDLFGIRARRAA